MLTLSRPAGVRSRGVADLVAESAHYRPIGELWVSLSREKAVQVMHDVLARDLAYSGVVMPNADALELAAGFVAHVGDSAEFFTNGSWSEPPAATSTVTRVSSWEPLSRATFDAGVVGVGDDCAAMLWVEDED